MVNIRLSLVRRSRQKLSLLLTYVKDQLIITDNILIHMCDQIEEPVLNGHT